MIPSDIRKPLLALLQGIWPEATQIDIDHVTPEELAWFTAFSHADVSYDPYCSIARRLKGEQEDILATYLFAEALHAQHALTRVLYEGLPAMRPSAEG
jgi:hypothetical protein